MNHGSIHDYLDRLSQKVFSRLQGNEAITLNLSGEDQTYVRWNGSLVRQITGVEQYRLGMSLQSGPRRVSFQIDLTQHLEQDVRLTETLLERGREEFKSLPEDPFVTPLIKGLGQIDRHQGDLPDLDQWIEAIRSDVNDLDFAGLLAAGTQVRAFRNSEGLSQGFETESFFLDYSLYTKNAASENKAVKGLYAGRNFDHEQWRRSLAQSRSQLEVLKRPNRILEPGEYRTYLSPSAVSALIQMFSWGAVSYGAYRRGDSALRKLIEGQETLSPLFSLDEQFGLGLSPRFNSQGETAPEMTSVIERGAIKQLMTSSRSAKEYGVPENGADSGEGLRSPSVRAGSLNESEVLSELGTGLYLGNLHYLNWSDLDSARITGMTRYACFWVEDGAIVQPIKDMRFDESLYRIFGSELEELTRTREIEIRTDTYHQRALGGVEVPGALIRNFKFTL